MKISELSERSGVPVATVKFYIREGMLPRGEALSTTRAEYGEEHLTRLRLISALAPSLVLEEAHVGQLEHLDGDLAGVGVER